MCWKISLGFWVMNMQSSASLDTQKLTYYLACNFSMTLMRVLSILYNLNTYLTLAAINDVNITDVRSSMAGSERKHLQETQIQKRTNLIIRCKNNFWLGLHVSMRTCTFKRSDAGWFCRRLWDRIGTYKPKWEWCCLGAGHCLLLWGMGQRVTMWDTCSPYLSPIV